MSPAAALLENQSSYILWLCLPSLPSVTGGESAERVLCLSVQERAVSEKLREVHPRADGEAERIFSTGTTSSKDVGERKGMWKQLGE